MVALETEEAMTDYVVDTMGDADDLIGDPFDMDPGLHFEPGLPKIPGGGMGDPEDMAGFLDTIMAAGEGVLQTLHKAALANPLSAPFQKAADKATTTVIKEAKKLENSLLGPKSKPAAPKTKIIPKPKASTTPFYKTPLGIGAIAAGVLVAGGGIYYATR